MCFLQHPPRSLPTGSVHVIILAGYIQAGLNALRDISSQQSDYEAAFKRIMCFFVPTYTTRQRANKKYQ